MLSLQVLLFLIVAHATVVSVTAAGTMPIRVAIIGDYGRAKLDHPVAAIYNNQTGEAAVAALIAAWQPTDVLTNGDNNYPRGENSTIDANIGQFYHSFMFPYHGSYGQGSSDLKNHFWPTLGNHDGYTTMFGVEAWPYLNYFRSMIPSEQNPNANNPQGILAKRYYSVIIGPVHFLMLNSNTWEPDGITSNSVQAQWTKNTLAASTSPFKVIMWHHLPFTNNHNDPENSALRWPFKNWGASFVMSGHAHAFEHLVIDGMDYFTNGLGGTVSRYPHQDIFPNPSYANGETRAWFNATWGFVKMFGDETKLQVAFTSLDGLFYYNTVFYPLSPSSATTTASPVAPPPTTTTSTAASSGDNDNKKNSGSASETKHGSSSSGIGTGVLIGVISCVSLGLLVAGIYYFIRKRREDALAALGGGAGRRTYSITPTRGLANSAEIDYQEMRDGEHNQLDSM